MELSATEALGTMATSYSCAPIMVANFCRALAISPIQISYHACAPHSFHISMNCSRPRIDRCERAPREQLFKYVFRCSMGNSERYANSSGCSMAVRTGDCILDSFIVNFCLLLQAPLSYCLPNTNGTNAKEYILYFIPY